MSKPFYLFTWSRDRPETRVRTSVGGTSCGHDGGTKMTVGRRQNTAKVKFLQYISDKYKLLHYNSKEKGI